MIDPSSTIGIYELELVLSDDNLEDPKQTEYRFKIQIKKKSKEDEQDQQATAEEYIFVPDFGEKEKEIDKEEPIIEKEAPSLRVSELSDTGLLKITFTQEIRFIDFKSEDSAIYDGLQIKIEPNEQNEFIEEEKDNGFKWTVKEFEKFFIKIQIEWNNPASISAGLKRDRLVVSVTDPDLFFSGESLRTIPLNTTQSISIPKMMPNTEFIETFNDLSQATEQATTAALIGNFAINIILSGSMQFLWGMIHCMQIIAFFPLIHVMMPANANKLFSILVKIATFDLFPAEFVIEGIEEKLSITHDEIFLTENFVEFGFDSTTPMMNLELIFIIYLILLAFPLVPLLLKALFFWCETCKKVIARINKTMYFNTYLRIGMETYLELAVVVLLRFRHLLFTSYSEIVHSSIAIFLMLIVVALPIFPLVFTQLKFASLTSARIKSMCGDMYLGLKVTERTAILYPFIFLLSRILYALMLVNWVD